MGLGTECPYCGADNKAVGVQLKAAARKVSGFRLAPVLAGTCVFLFAAVLAVGGVSPPSGGFDIVSPDIWTVMHFGSHVIPGVEGGEWWRLFTAVFLHLGLLHVGFNAYLTYTAGRWLEDDLGPRLLFLVFMGGGVLGFVGSQYWAGGGAGASGGVSAIFGALLVRRRLIDGNFRHPITMYVIQLVLLNMLLGFVLPNVNNVAHGVGFVFGGAIGFVLTRLRLPKLAVAGLVLTTFLLAIATVAAFGIALTHAITEAHPNDVREAGTCVVERRTDPLDGSEGFYPRILWDDAGFLSKKRAKVALDCLNETSLADDERVPPVARLVQALGDGLSAEREGDEVTEQEAVRAIQSEIIGFRDWIERDYPSLRGQWFKAN